VFAKYFALVEIRGKPISRKGKLNFNVIALYAQIEACDKKKRKKKEEKKKERQRGRDRKYRRARKMIKKMKYSYVARVRARIRAKLAIMKLDVEKNCLSMQYPL